MGADAVGDGTVWMAEDSDSTDSLLLAGRFSGYLERDGRPNDRFEDLEAEDAIAWGRARAAKVLIRTGDSGCYFSAGERNPDPREYPEWAATGLRLERRRPGGFEALDNTESATRRPFGMSASALSSPTRQARVHFVRGSGRTRLRRMRRSPRRATPLLQPRSS